MPPRRRPTPRSTPAPARSNVNYGGYLSKHDIVYNKPNTNPLYGLTVGNGQTGAMVWNANGLTMQVSGVDLSQQSAFAAGLVNLTTTPAHGHRRTRPSSSGCRSTTAR